MDGLVSSLQTTPLPADLSNQRNRLPQVTTNPSKCSCGASKIPMTDGSKIIWPDWFCYSCKDQYTWENDSRYNRLNWAPEPIGMPIVFKETIAEKIPCPKMRDVATNWDAWKTRSLLLHGTTRLGKSRAAWEVSRRHWKANYKRQQFVTMRKFEQNIEEGFSKFNHNKLVGEMVNVPFLFIDDLGKEKMTARIACDLFAVIDERTINQRPTIITTNFTSGGLLERFDDVELGKALIGRFKDFFDCVGATKKDEITS